MDYSDITPLVEFYQSKLRQTNTSFHRYLFSRINWKSRIIGIMGARGVGKTTMLLQRIVESVPNPADVFYMSLDHFWFNSNSLPELIDFLYKRGINELYIDEVHKYKGWAQLLKNIYDQYADIRIVYTGSSLLEIDNSKTDLSRRQTLYTLEGMSFREFLDFEGILKVKELSLDEILKRHVNIAMEISSQIKVQKHFETYLIRGYYPFQKEAGEDYLQRLSYISNTVIESDLPAVGKFSYETIEKTKRLLGIIARNVPLTPNIEKMSATLSTTRDSLLRMLYLLDKAELLELLTTELKSYKKLVKPEKIYLGNTNLMYALGSKVDIGTLRETFVVNQLSEDHTVQASQKGDVLIDGTVTLEIGGKAKDYSQIAGMKDSYLAIDDIETGFGNRIPLWMFGLLY